MVATVSDSMDRAPRRGRPRATPAKGMVRRNLLVDADALDQLRRLYGARSDSEAIRHAVDAALLVAEARELRAWLAARGGPVDTFGRTAAAPPLPVYLTERDEVPKEDDVRATG